jgi:hypothetical protein
LNLGSFRDLDEIKLPFPRVEPVDMAPSSISFRPEGNRWCSIRFTVEYNGVEYRIKEFFLDWFFLGFPKPLMKNFVETYSKIIDQEINDFIVFIGNDYKGMYALSSFVHGTQVEIETRQNNPKDISELFSNLRVNGSDLQRLNGLQYVDRSFFARGRHGDWFEDERISRVHWQRSENKPLAINGKILSPSGLGILSTGGKEQRILVLEEDNFHRCVWIETTDSGIDIPYAFYKLRPGKYLYDDFTEGGDAKKMTKLSRKKSGPSVVQFEYNGKIVTIGFSAGFSENDVFSFLDKTDMLIGAALL